MRWSLLLKSPDLILLFLFSDQRWLYHQHWLVREEEQGILGACWRAVLLWLVVCPGRLDHDTLDVFHLCGVFSTISMIMVYSVIRGESFTEGVLGVGGARIWFFVCFLMSFASFTGKHILNVWKDLDLAQDNIFRKSFQLEINIKTTITTDPNVWPQPATGEEKEVGQVDIGSIPVKTIQPPADPGDYHCFCAGMAQSSSKSGSTSGWHTTRPTRCSRRSALAQSWWTRGRRRPEDTSLNQTMMLDEEKIMIAWGLRSALSFWNIRLTASSQPMSLCLYGQIRTTRASCAAR